MPFHRRPCKPKDDDEDVGATASPLDSYLAELEGLGYRVKVVDVSARPLPEMRQRVWMLCALPDSGYDVTLWASQVEELEKICSGKPVVHMASMMRLIKGAEQTPAAELTGPPKEESWASDASYHKSFGMLLSKARAEKSLIVKSVDKRASNKFSCLKQATEWQKANVDACEALLDELCRQVPNVRTHPCADVSQTCGRAHLSLDGTWGTLTTSTTIMDFKQKVMHGPALHAAILGWPCNLLTSGGLPANLSQSEIREMTGNSMSLAALVKILLPLCTACGFAAMVQPQ